NSNFQLASAEVIAETCAGKDPTMQKKIIIIVVSVAVFIGIGLALSGQEKGEGGKYEFAVVKWDGPDRLYYKLPGKFPLVHLRTWGVAFPKELPEEEFCLAYAANQMAKDGWDAVNLNSRRILFRRAKK